jgi:hypothetical protein
VPNPTWKPAFVAATVAWENEHVGNDAKLKEGVQAMVIINTISVIKTAVANMSIERWKHESDLNSQFIDRIFKISEFLLVIATGCAFPTHTNWRSDLSERVAAFKKALNERIKTNQKPYVLANNDGTYTQKGFSLHPNRKKIREHCMLMRLTSIEDNSTLSYNLRPPR